MNPKLIYKSKDPFDLGARWTVVRDDWHFNTDDFRRALWYWWQEVKFVVRRRFNREQMTAYKELKRWRR